MTRRTWLFAVGVVALLVGATLGIVTLSDDDANDGEVVAETSTTGERDTTTAAPTTTAPPQEGFRSPLLWPFTSEHAAAVWQQEFRSGGHQPWHLDAEQTALSFTSGYLGFTEIDRVTSSDIGATEAHVGVGYMNPDNQMSTAAVIHLIRIGSGEDAPWEVVGTADEDLTLEIPEYGSTVQSPVTVGGHVSGVDESLRVQVRQPSSLDPLGESCCLPAGGTNSPWETTVEFSGATDPALTIVVSSGGHVQDVERFAITAVRH